MDNQIIKGIRGKVEARFVTKRVSADGVEFSIWQAVDGLYYLLAGMNRISHCYRTLDGANDEMNEYLEAMA